MNKVVNYSKAFGVLLVALTWFAFSKSAHKFTSHEYYYYLLYGRSALVILGVGIGALVLFTKWALDMRLFELFFLLSIAFQSLSSHLVGGSRDYEFLSYVGPLYLIFGLGNTFSLTTYFRVVFPIVTILMFWPLFFKELDMVNGVTQLVYWYSMPIACWVVGTVIVVLNAQKHEAISRLLAAERALLREKEKNLFSLENQNRRVAEEIEHIRQEMKQNTSHVVYQEVFQKIAHDLRSPLLVFDLVSKQIQQNQKVDISLFREALHRIKVLASDVRLHEDLLGAGQNIDELEFGRRLEQMIDNKVQVFSPYKSLFEVKSSVVGNFMLSSKKVEEIIQHLSNLLDNAIESTTPLRINSILVEAFGSDSEVKLSVSDRGQGMSSENLKRYGSYRFSTKEKLNNREGNGLGTYYFMRYLKENKLPYDISSIKDEGTSICFSVLGSKEESHQLNREH